MQLKVSLEVGPKRRVFAQATDWIGWCRAGRDESAALSALLAAGARYAAVASAAGLAPELPVSPDDLTIVERVAGGSVTDFGGLSVPIALDLGPLDDTAVDRVRALLQACWNAFDAALAAVPAIDRAVKPGAGRAPETMRLHLIDTDRMHLAAFGHAYRQLDAPDADRVERETRQRLLEGLEETPRGIPFEPIRRYGFAWTPAFAARRSAWHALEHAWELDDRRAGRQRGHPG